MRIASTSIVIMLFAINWVYKVLGKTSFYPMDDVKVCEDSSTKWLKDDEHAIILGKTKPPTEEGVSQNCHIQIAPSEENKLKHLQLRFDSFYINDCDIHLKIFQAPSSSPQDFGEEMASLSCTSFTPPVLYAEEGNLVRLNLNREEKAKIDYNFRINVTSTEGPIEAGGISSNVLIGLCVGGGVVLLLLLLLLLRYLCNRKSAGAEDSDPNSHRVTYSPVQPSVDVSQSLPIDNDDRNKPPLPAFNTRTGPPTPEHHALLENGQTANQINTAPPGHGEGPDGEVSALTELPQNQNALDPESAYVNTSGNNLPERDHSFRAARGDSPPPSYEDAVGLPLTADQN